MNPNKSISYEPFSLQKKQYPIKQHLSQLAIKIKVDMDENQILIDNINNICINIRKSKQQLKKFSSMQNKTNIENELIKNITNLKTSNKNLAMQRKILLQKYIKLKTKYNNELEPLNTELNILSDRKFIMENIISKKDYDIVKYTLAYNDSLNLYLREEKREFYSNNLDMDEDIIIIDLEKKQTLLLNKLKDYNKTINKIIELKKNINLMKNIINKIKSKNIEEITKEEEKIIFNQKINNKNKYIDYKFIEELSNSKEEDSILNDTINSEYEDDDNIEFIPISNNYYPIILDGKIKIPRINLEQIEYNKRKLKQEDGEKSLSREIKEYDEKEMKIKELKNKIKKAKNKNKRYQEKCVNFENKIKMMEKIIYNMKKYNFEMAKSSSRNKSGYNNKHFSARSVSNNGGRQQMNSYSVRGRNSKFGNTIFNNNIDDDIENNDNSENNNEDIYF